MDSAKVKVEGRPWVRRCLSWAGWTLHFDGLPARQGVIILYPHTSNWDFVWGMWAKWAAGLDLTFWGKDTLFRIPLFGMWLRSMGGVPVDRFSSKGAVAQMVEVLRRAKASDEFCWVALSPEGTRRYRDAWRSGFHQLAVQADVPLTVAVLDYAHREVRLVDSLRLSGDAALDLPAIARLVKGVVGKRPDQAAPIRLAR